MRDFNPPAAQLPQAPAPRSSLGSAAIGAPSLLSGPAGEMAQAWQKSRQRVDLWFSDETGILMRLTGAEDQLTLRAWIEGRTLARASIRGPAGSEVLCPESGSALDGREPAARALAALDALRDCSERCAPCCCPSLLRRALFLK